MVNLNITTTPEPETCQFTHGTLVQLSDLNVTGHVLFRCNDKNGNLCAIVVLDQKLAGYSRTQIIPIDKLELIKKKEAEIDENLST